MDIMGADGGMEIPVVGGSHLTVNQVEAHLGKYDYCVGLLSSKVQNREIIKAEM